MSLTIWFNAVVRLLLYSIITMVLALLIVSKVQAGSATPAMGDTSNYNRLLKEANATLAVPRKADSLAQKVFQDAKQSRQFKYAGRAAVLLFTIALPNGVEKAMRWYDTAHRYFKKQADPLWMGYAEMNLGVTLNQKYQFDKGIPRLINSAGFFKAARDTAMIGSAYTAIAVAFHDFQNYQSGKAYAHMAIATLQTALKATPALRWRALTALAINYDDNQEYDEALKLHKQNLANAKEPIYQVSTLNNMGNTYSKKGQFSLAEKYLQRSLQIARDLNNDYQFATIYNNLVNVNVGLKRNEVAAKYLDSALFSSKKSGSPEKLLDTYETAYRFASRRRNFEQAIKYLEQRSALKDSLLNADKTRIVYDLQIKYETEKKESENRRLQYLAERRATARDQAESDKRLIIYAFVIGLVVLSAVLLLLYRNHKIRSRYSHEQNLNKAIFESEQKERIRIARDLHDSIGQMLSVIKMNLSGWGDHPVQEYQLTATIAIVDKTITEVRHISHNLIPEELNFGLFAALEDLAEKINQSGSTVVDVRVPEEIKAHQFDPSNQLSIYRIVQEVLNNMVKHAQATHIALNASQSGQTMILTIKDNGKGFDVSKLRESQGLGWKNIAARVNLLEGKLQVQSEQLSGTEIEITIPKA